MIPEPLAEIMENVITTRGDGTFLQNPTELRTQSYTLALLNAELSLTQLGSSNQFVFWLHSGEKNKV